MEVAKRNVNDGISLAQVAEGTMQKMTDILQRGRELAVQAANGTNSKSDRQALFAEYSQVLHEFERMSRTANFNGHKLLDGSFSAQTFQVGANAGQTIDVSVPALKENALGFHKFSSSDPSSLFTNFDFPSFQDFGRNSFSNWMSTIATGATDRKLVIQGKELPIDEVWNVGEVARLINNQEFEPEIRAETKASISFSGPLLPGQVTLRLVAGEDYSEAQSVTFFWDGSPTAAQNAMEAINQAAGVTDVRAESYYASDNGRPFFRLVSTEGENLHIMNDSNPPATITLLEQGLSETGGVVTRMRTFPSTFPSTLGSGVFGVDDVFFISSLELVSDGEFSFKGDAKYEYDVNGDEIRTGLIGGGRSNQVTLDNVSFASTRKASDALLIFDAAINQVSRARADLGAVQSRFEATIANLDISSEKTAAARGRIVDADFALETAQLARQQILQNAGTAMVAQANSMPEQILTLLKGI